MKASFTTALLGLLVALVCVTLSGFALALAGWHQGYLVGRIGCFLILTAGVVALVVDFQRKKRGENLVPVKRTGRKRSLDFPPREFRHQNRGLLTGLLSFFAVAPVLGATILAVARLTKLGNIPAEAVLAVSAIAILMGSTCAWCALRVWNASIVLAPEGVTVRMTNSRGTFGWDELIGFERVQISDGNGEMHWWFRLVTAKRAYLFQDTLENREWFIRTVTQASGLQLVDAK